MSNVLIDSTAMAGIANAIRAKKETTDTYLPSEMPTAIMSIDGGGGGMINYSTEEQVVGTWIDGSALYQKTIILNDVKPYGAGSEWWSSDIDITSLDIKSIINAMALSVDNNTYPVTVSTSISTNLRVMHFRSSTSIKFTHLTMQYTKTT